ncbi:matrix-remodeling-associated protein 7 isoform X1 [Numida meleagris]|uniref:matrix-remodeling-associated protein 7 isoform X1 n=1 Tax=Numida meleagris TaxID=8996 RepID=UPI000B3D9A9E|nr:matrix-remodeling-associated protein 7 isoform X1 [Numida meleagris]
MDVAVDLYLAVPLLFTVLAIVLASVFVKLRSGEGQRAAERQPEPGREEPGKAEPGKAEPGSAAGSEAEPQGATEGPGGEGSRVPVEEVGAGDEGKEKEKVEEKEEKEKEAAVAEQRSAAERSPESIPQPPPAAEHREQQQQQQEEEEEESKEEDPDSDSEKLVVKETEDEDAADETFSFKYSPGKLRGNQYKSMMTKEELEEEQRVQREQLAAIFRLMKEKSDTFGEMSEGDMKEQLKLYDI